MGRAPRARPGGRRAPGHRDGAERWRSAARDGRRRERETMATKARARASSGAGCGSSATAWGGRGGRGINLVVVGTCATYVVWVLLGTVAWISHLGARVESLGRWLPAMGYPGNEPARSIWSFGGRNVPAAAAFVVPHSVLLPSRLRRWCGKYGRLAYNVMSAATLHAFLAIFAPLKTPVVMKIPFGAWFHDALSVGCLAYASYAFLSSRSTYGLLGISDALGIRDPRYANPSAGMDAITWMGVTTWRLGGAFAFVLFTGLSIIPRELTLGDCITRCVAAFYLRKRSRSFREWVEKIEGVHLLTWILRAALLSTACYGALRENGDLRAVAWIFLGAASLAGILRLAEADAERRRARTNVPRARRKSDSASSLCEAAPATCDDVAVPTDPPERAHARHPHCRSS